MKKKLVAILCAAAMLVASAIPAAADDETYTWSIAYSYADTTQHGRNMIKLKELVEEKTDGRIQVTLYPNSQLGTINDEINLVSSGAVDSCYTINSITETVNPLEGLMLIPFLINTEPGDPQLVKAINESENAAGVLNRLAEEAGFKRFGNIPTSFGAFILANNVRPVNAPEDAKGLKIRTSGGDMPNLFINSLGASPVTIPGSEVPIGLQQGVFDGLTAVLVNYNDSNWHTKYLSLPYNCCYTTPLYASLNWWENMPADLQEIVENEVMPELYDWVYEELSTAELDALDDIQENHGVEVTYWDMEDPDIQAYCEQVREEGIQFYIDNYGDDAQTMIDEILKLKEEIYG